MKRTYWIIAGAVLILVGAGVGIFLHFRTATAPQGGAMQFVPASDTPASSTQPTIPGYLIYDNPQYHFSIEYPPDLQISQTAGGSGSGTILFQDPSSHEGFQIFVVPYDESKVSIDRFNEDEPSGVMENPTNTTIDGVEATAFYSTNTSIGDTYEIWFIQNGLLYEVTTYQQLDSWLSQIMQTWKFI